MGSALSATAKEVSAPAEYLTALPSHTLEENLRTTRFLKVRTTSSLPFSLSAMLKEAVL